MEPQGDSRGPRALGAHDERELRASFYLLAVMAVLLPPFVGGGAAMVLAGFYPFPEFFTIFLDFPTLYILATLGLALAAVGPLHRRVVRLAGSGALDRPEAVRRLLRRGTFALLGAITVYSVVGAYTADLSLHRNDHMSFTEADHLLSQFGLTLVVLLCALPIATLYVDRVSRYLAPRGLGIGAATLRSKVVLLALIVPALIDTMLLSYVYNETGFFSARTVLLWGALLALAAAGAILIWRSIEQSLAPLAEYLSRDIDDREGISDRPIVPLSLDELGEMAARLDRLRARELSLLRRLREAERVARVGTWRSTLDGGLYWSPETEAICGLPKGAFTGRSEDFFGLIHPEDRDRVRAQVDDALAEGKEYTCVHRLVRPDGKVLTVFEKASIERGEDGRPIALSGIIQDISDKIALEEQLRQSQKMEAIGNLTGGIAHDFNNLLAVVRTNLELLREKDADEDGSDYVEGALRAVERGRELTRNMLSFARRARLEPAEIDLNEVVRDLERWCARVLPETITVDTALARGLWRVAADPAATQSAVLNLVLNARDAMPDGGRLTIETANLRVEADDLGAPGDEMAPGPYVLLAVSDTGSGIDPALRRRIFEPFFTTKPTGSGSGLGLSMVQGFMQQSGGNVRVYSEPGNGTSFKLFFPALPAPPAGTAPAATDDAAAAAAPPAPPRPGARLLVVEDQPEVLKATAEALRKAGFLVSTAPNGDSARAIFAADPSFDLLVTDIVMPGRLQGAALARDLRQLRPDLPVVFLTGYASEGAANGNGLRPDEIRLMKPVGRAELLAAVARALARSG